MLCPGCNRELSDFASDCAVCGWELSQDQKTDWVKVGLVESQAFAEMGREALKQSEIPAVLISRSGMFGAAGLTLDPLITSGSGSFEISVPASQADEALSILEAVLGDSFQRSNK